MELKIWVSQYTMQDKTPEQLQDPAVLFESAVFSNGNMDKMGFTQVGTVPLGEMTIFSRDKMIEAAVESLKAQAATIRADASAKCTKIEGKINQLLALEMSAPVGEEFQ